MLIAPKVLHVVETLHRAAIENWLLRMLRHARDTGTDIDWTFYCIAGEPGTLEAAAADLGAGVKHSPVPIGRKRAFVRALRTELVRGHYDVLHCHHDLVSALYLVSALGVPLSKRIVHVHNADEAVLTPHPLKKAVLRPAARYVCRAVADHIVGISHHTLDTFLGGRARREGVDVVHYYGADPEPFARPALDRHAFRRELGLPQEARILLFAGRMVPEKNPVFAVDVLAALHQRDPMAYGVFVGSGSLDAAALDRARSLGVAHAYKPLEWRLDIPDVMACCDWFILTRPDPPPMEGFGLAVLEAQLAGLRMLLSAAIADDPLLPSAVYERLPIAAGAPKWADAALRLIRRDAPSREQARADLRHSPMDLDHALASLMALHS